MIKHNRGCTLLDDEGNVESIVFGMISIINTVINIK